MSEYKELNINDLQEIEVRNDKDLPWVRRRLIKIIDDGRALCFALNFPDSFFWKYHREIKESPKREMTPFEAKVLAEENNAQMVYIDNEKDIRIGSVLFAWERIENYRYIPNKKIKELKGQITWDDCSEFPMVEVEE